MTELFRYQCESGREPLTDWLDTLRDKAVRARIHLRLSQLQAGNPGDCKAVGEGVMELRIHIGAGYRIYCGRRGDAIVILLCGGDKGSQATDIKQAHEYWKDWKRRRA